MSDAIQGAIVWGLTCLLVIGGAFEAARDVRAARSARRARAAVRARQKGELVKYLDEVSEKLAVVSEPNSQHPRR